MVFVKESVNLADNAGFTPLDYAAEYDNPDSTRFLLDNGATINKCTIFQACRGKENYRCIKILHEKGADINALVEDNRYYNAAINPLHHAAGWGNYNAIDILISLGANPDIKSGEGKTPAEFALAHNHPNIAYDIPVIAKQYQTDLEKRRGMVYQTLFKNGSIPIVVIMIIQGYVK